VRGKGFIPESVAAISQEGERKKCKRKQITNWLTS